MTRVRTRVKDAVGKLPTKEWSRKSWHRRASKPVTVWMMIFVLAGLVHLWIPEYRWVLIHIFTLGIVTNSIMLWSQHFTERFLQQKLDDDTRPGQLRRFQALNLGIVLTIVGEILVEWWDKHWILTQIGATIIIVVLLIHTVSLLRQWMSSEKGKKYRPAVFGYVLSAAFLPVGGVFGALLSMELPVGLHENVRLAHLITNVLGFVGLAAAASLSVLFPAIWRTRGRKDRTGIVISLLSFGVVVATVGCFADSTWVTGGGLAVYTFGWLVGLVSWLGNVIDVLKDPRDRVTYASGSVLMAVLWLIGILVWLTAEVFMATELPEVSLPTTVLLIGFGAQLLLGVMSYLLPTTMGGGPGAVRTGMAVLNKGGLFRLTLINLGLVLWQVATYSWLKVVLSFFVFGALVVFIPLLILAVRAQRKVLLKEAEPTPKDPQAKPAWNQLTAGLAVLTFVVVMFGGLAGPSTGGQATQSTGAENVTTVEISTVGMKFIPDVIEVPTGNSLEIVLTNDDDQAHDLRLANGVDSGRLVPGDSITIDAGVITENLDGWCTIAGHQAMGMTLTIMAV
ncbi:cupredoxin domain-containing protein [Corynebacterium lubricantis]|uniref:cupredoxin domain-containing protein n=1 Tax=Corynebacterium lubricantis TaxID=541095 RepID=UPI000A062453|nr:copper oxidase [Corynebacterium lubricantis]